jgi:hypothetical protein
MPDGAGFEPLLRHPSMGPITDEGVTIGGAFGSDTATGMTPMAHGVTGRAIRERRLP